MTQIHSTAVVSSDVELGENVEIGPFCVLDGPIKIGDGSILHSHVVVKGRTEIGSQAEIFPFASVGHRPQDLKYSGEKKVV